MVNLPLGNERVGGPQGVWSDRGYANDGATRGDERKGRQIGRKIGMD